MILCKFIINNVIILRVILQTFLFVGFSIEENIISLWFQNKKMMLQTDVLNKNIDGLSDLVFFTLLLFGLKKWICFTISFKCLFS